MIENKLLEELNQQRLYIETLPSLAMQRIIETYRQDIEEDTKLKNNEYEDPKEFDLIDRLRQRTTRTYSISLTDLLDGKEHPFDFDLTGIEFNFTIKPNSSGNEQIDFRKGRYVFDSIEVKLDETKTSNDLLKFILIRTSITYTDKNMSPTELESYQKIRHTEDLNELKKIQAKIEGTTDPMTMLSYRICTSAIQKYSN
ncbi:MAG: hypothetical protein ACMXYG_03855 [Candidatus Woesearchaeota archaeon]